MTRIVGNAGVVGDHNHGAYAREGEGQAQPNETPAEAAISDATDDVRLIIEGDDAGDGFTYTTIDRRTGAIIRRVPRAGLLALGEAPDYAAGSLIKVRA